MKKNWISDQLGTTYIFGSQLPTFSNFWGTKIQTSIISLFQNVNLGKFNPFFMEQFLGCYFLAYTLCARNLILTKFHNDWVRFVDFLIKAYFCQNLNSPGTQCIADVSNRWIHEMTNRLSVNIHIFYYGTIIMEYIVWKVAKGRRPKSIRSGPDNKGGVNYVYGMMHLSRWTRPFWCLIWMKVVLNLLLNWSPFKRVTAWME